MSEIPKMLKLREAAEIFGLSYEYIRRLAISGAIPAIRAGNGKRAKILVNEKGLADYLNIATLTDEEAPPIYKKDLRVFPA